MAIEKTCMDLKQELSKKNLSLNVAKLIEAAVCRKLYLHLQLVH